MSLSSVSALISTLLVVAPATAVIIDSGDGTGNTSAPSPDPGWSHVGTREAYTAVYLGSGWVLTASHVGAGDVVFGGVTYPWVGASAVRLSNPDATFADLLMFRIDPAPLLPDLPIASDPPPIGTELVLVGHGRNRGPATSWDPDPGPPPSGYDGYEWGFNFSMRWGTNVLADYPPPDPDLDTEWFSTDFDSTGETPHEAQAAVGDSGGAAFAWNGSGYELAGIMVAVGLVDAAQPLNVSLYGQSTLAADLSVYRDEIVQLMPEPAGCLWPAVALVAALARVGGPRRARR